MIAKSIYFSRKNKKKPTWFAPKILIASIQMHKKGKAKPSMKKKRIEETRRKWQRELKMQTQNHHQLIYNIVVKWCFHLILGTVAKEKRDQEFVIWSERATFDSIFLFNFFYLSINEYIEHIISFLYFGLLLSLRSFFRISLSILLKRM